ncbi:phosphoribulokinase/uridine kinase [Talaromyces proteolyticus]|uniref:Phosphoribulokinase/uridine kinase n=1 Tax=Talaromyces proteolyticus TaxID=1131652 RepID=A0AAD4KEB0_9EURO|nr:phosphoribulokinase/uridine kinase [Talaromyces proteolyticus]KAH8690212.1 phosphoribulokinase/uridine kinase [Talaromyces proteolyticus]
MEKEYAKLTSFIEARAAAHPKSKFLVAIAGAPGSGKTTIAAEVVRRINEIHPPKLHSDVADDTTPGEIPHAALLSMDGFHLPRSTLDTLPNRTEAYARRGAPFTFDLKLFLAFMTALRKWGDCSPSGLLTIYAPSFSHTKKDPIQNGISIPASTSILIIEGNYLLLNEPGWKEVASMVDLRVLISADLAVTRDRVARRHVRAGIEGSLEDAYRRVDGNDTLNGRLIQEKVVDGVDLVIHSVDDEHCSLTRD